MSTKQSAIEAAAIASYEQGDQYYGAWESLDASLREYGIKNAGTLIAAYLSAIAEDEASVEAVAGTVAEGFYFGMPQVDPDAVPDGLARDVARAVLRTLLERAKEGQG
jgi:hypothetical protein